MSGKSAKESPKGDGDSSSNDVKLRKCSGSQRTASQIMDTNSTSMSGISSRSTTLNANAVSFDLDQDKRAQKLPERDQWSGSLDFIMSMIAYAVGLGQ
ncbi:unnamed protein product [Gongylonema pulchrum]|uniref:PGG domain-containing protein n=1 Tax=Gongylonema pulchrum TaxID=637853 RepID=A0A183DDV9_9BILA|nr:unnamed protein product [Gongylonema pulchrum]